MFITIEDANLFTLSFGSKTAPALLALSGWIGSWEDWADTLSLLSENWRTLSYDHRGSGLTRAPVQSITFDRLVDDVFAILDAYQVERCVLAAMSMGAAVAFGAVLKDPSRFSGLVMVNAANLRDPQPPNAAFLAGLQRDYARTLDFFADACIPEQGCDLIKDWGRRILDRASPEAAIALYRMALPIHLREGLSRITQPTLILHGDADTLAPIDTARWLAATLPNATLVPIPGAGHVPILTRPHIVAEEINKFF